MTTKKHTRTEKEILNQIEKLIVELANMEGYAPKHSTLMHFSIPMDGKKLSVHKLYEKLGFSENSVMCGECYHRGSIRKRGEYYEVRHKRAKKDTCYLGKDPSLDLFYLPIGFITRHNGTRHSG